MGPLLPITEAYEGWDLFLLAAIPAWPVTSGIPVSEISELLVEPKLPVASSKTSLNVAIGVSLSS